MGSDYYIVNFLHIYYNNYDYCDNKYLEIELVNERRYYNNYDENEKDCKKNTNEYKNNFRMKPIIIYNNNIFNELSFDIKYRNIIENEINKYDKHWYEVTKVVKIEERYER